MTVYLTATQLIELHDSSIEAYGGMSGILDHGMLESAAYAPAQTFDGHDLLVSMPEKAAALGHSLVSNHPFVDGNKRIAFIAVQSFLELNDCQLECEGDELEGMIQEVSDGRCSRDEFKMWMLLRTAYPDL